MVDFKQKKTTIKETECFAMQEFQPIKEGKVREIYDNGDSLIMVATDRISAFDVILKNKVTNKGKVLTQMSKFWFDYTRDVLPNHMLSVDTKDMPEFFQQKKYDGIWACSSILHLSKDELKNVMQRMLCALKDDGVIYTSFKYGTFEGERNGRYFTDFTEKTFDGFLSGIRHVKIEEQWLTGDVRPGRESEQWLNLILRKV